MKGEYSKKETLLLGSLKWNIKFWIWIWYRFTGNAKGRRCMHLLEFENKMIGSCAYVVYIILKCKSYSPLNHIKDRQNLLWILSCNGTKHKRWVECGHSYMYLSVVISFQLCIFSTALFTLLCIFFEIGSSGAFVIDPKFWRAN